MTTHYVAEAAYKEFTIRRERLLLSACGQHIRLGEKFTFTPRLVECPACKRVMVGEETRA